MSFHEDVVNAFHDLRPVKQGFEQIDFCAFNIHF